MYTGTMMNLFTILVEFFVYVFCSVEVNFRATQVFPNNCSLKDPFALLFTDTLILCSLECSRDLNCRRFMACKHMGMVNCFLYIEGENCVAHNPDDCRCMLQTRSRFNGSTICPIGLYGDNCENIIKDCSEGSDHGWDVDFNGWVHSYIQPSGWTTAFEVICEFKYSGLTLFMARDWNCQHVDFDRNITEYINGFGEVEGDHWLGLSKIKSILDNHPRNKLSVVLMHGPDYCENYYDEFSLGLAVNGYPIQLGQYESDTSSQCGNSLTNNINIEGSSFSTIDSDYTSFKCSTNFKGGWWYANETGCSESLLMGAREAMIWPSNRHQAPQTYVGLRTRPY